MVRYTIDTSFAVKGLIPPRRKKQDEILAQQEKIYKLARSYIDKVRHKDDRNLYPCHRLSGNRDSGIPHHE